MNLLFPFPGRWHAFAIGAAIVAVVTSGAEPVRGNEEGIPFVQRFTPREYHGHSQSLAFAIDSRGLLHVANLTAVLQYDGATWRRLPVPGTSTIYGVAIAADGRVYVGAARQVGYFETDATGLAKFVSLADRIPPELRPPDEAYRQVVATSDGVFFECVNSILRWHDGQFDALPIPKEDFPGIHSSGEELFVSRPEAGLFVLRAGKLELVSADDRLIHQGVRAVVRLPDGSLLIGLLRSGVFRHGEGKLEPFVSPELQQEFSDRLVSDIVQLTGGEIAVSTYRGGIAFLDERGTPLRWLDDGNGLESPLVARLLQDAEGGLWCIQENGLARVEVHSPVTVFDGRVGVSSSASEFARHDGTLYLGTLRGVLQLVPATGPGNPAHWKPVAGAAGQAFALESHPDGLLASVDRDIVRIRGGAAESVVQLSSLTYALTRSTRDPNVVYASNRYGLAALRLSEGTWINEGFLPGFKHELRELYEDPGNGTIWFGTAAHGAGRITGAGRDPANWWEGAVLTGFNEESGLPDDGLALLDRASGRTIFTTSAGAMVFNEGSGRFEALPRSEIGPAREGDWYWVAMARDSEGNSWGILDRPDSDVNLLGTQIEYGMAQEARELAGELCRPARIADAEADSRPHPM
jgi:hypothetical protein